MQYLHLMYKNNRTYPKDAYLKKINQLSIPSSLGVSIDCGHVLIFQTLICNTCIVMIVKVIIKANLPVLL
jgi:hypothetical protein